MRIGFDSKRIFSNFRGLGSYSRNLVRDLCDTFPESEYYLYTPEFQAHIIDHYFANCKCIKVRTPSIVRPKILAQAWRNFALNGAIQKDRLDIYHGLSHQLPSGAKPGSTKWVVTVHDLLFLRYPQYFSPIDRWIYSRKIRYSTSVADSVIAISKQTKKDLMSFMRVPEEKITVLHQSSDPMFQTRISDEEKKEIRHRYHLPDKYILYVGALLPHKNVLAILKAMNQLKRDVGFHFVVVGSGLKYQKSMVQFASQVGLQDRLIFLSNQGYINNTELRGIYQMATLFIYPSMFEGFGLPILEALRSQVPVIANFGLEEAGGPHSLYSRTDDDGESLAETIKQFFADSNLQQSMVRGGLLHAQNFDQKTTSKALMEHYRSLVD
ncbi:MAG: glycosyltransferase family 4 protein [Cyclobacteriaceae bacterium]